MGFSDFLSNTEAVEQIRRMLDAGRVPGALLFAGPEGVGKKTLALMLAKALNCERLKDDFCGECARCRKAAQMIQAAEEDLARRREIKDSRARVEGLVYFDVQFIAPITGYILIEQIRELRATALTMPFELPQRVFIIDEAESVHWQAADLLLKMLEEPPATTRIILICRNPFELRTTIRSRCRQIVFHPADDSVIEKNLPQANGLTPPQRRLAVRVAGGSIAAAKNLDLSLYEQRRRPWLDYVQALAGASPELADWRAVFSSSKTLAENRAEWNETLSTGAILAADLLRALADDSGKTLVNLDIAPRIRSYAVKLGFRGITMLHAGLQQAYRQRIRNINPELSLEALALDIASTLPGK